MKDLTIITKDRFTKEQKAIAELLSDDSRYHAYTKEFGEAAYLYEFGTTRKEARQKLKEKCKGFKNVFESLFKKHDLPMTRNGIVEHEEFCLSLFPNIKHDYFYTKEDGSGWFKKCPPYVVLSLAVKFKNSKKENWDIVYDEIKTMQEYRECINEVKEFIKN
tara:strand:+ start:28 stop:513 length:486 start_codon:yes stop_codon:yes gene_type:complete